MTHTLQFVTVGCYVNKKYVSPRKGTIEDIR